MEHTKNKLKIVKMNTYTNGLLGENYAVYDMDTFQYELPTTLNM